ncbi:glycoside hydrolase family 18 protein [Hypoxylon trugodes]|uniref:glycoside hydrolase family 18 protein n=1 Tax=Hypoxylon trugodes TaxID=326681 RepID=UPI00219E2DCB|nr:glycoside hydrolase family 18 protein [Hypoxylon trugodes]KAI1383236.1 glycoside hydrolase family 18 protein [Hypoxylon trugodes]
MQKTSLWGLAQCLLWAGAYGIERRDDCEPVYLTTTLFLSTTIYTTAPPNVTSVPSTSAPFGNTTAIPTSSPANTTSLPFGNSTTSIIIPTTGKPPVGTPTTSLPIGNTTTGITISPPTATPPTSIGTTTSAPFSNSTTSGIITPTGKPPGLPGNSTTGITVSPTTATPPSSIGTTTSAPFVNTTTSVIIPTTGKPPGSSTSIPSGNTTTGITASPTTATPPSSIGTTTSVPFGNTTTSVIVPPTTSAPPSSTPSPTTSPPAEPTRPIPPAFPPGPFRGYKNAVYFTNWGVNAGFHPQELPVSELTHILYAFADIDEDGTVKSSDPVIDLQKRYPDDSKLNVTRNAYGAVKQLFLHKKYNRNLKTILSIGGWNYSPKFVTVAASDATRFKFATTAVKLVTDWGFDGIDIDWEYPNNDVEKANFVKLLEACRHAFDRYSLLHGLRYRFTISVASPASPQNYDKLDLVGMNRYVDNWNLMAYDYSGSWDTVSGHQANVFSYLDDPAVKKPSTDDAIRHYESQGIHPRKILMGLPVYGRAFEGTSGIGQNYSSVGEGGPQPGVFYYKDLPKPGADVVWDDVAKATYSYDPDTKELISYDNVRSTNFKSEYLQWRDLGGAFFWEASGDKGGGQGLVNTMSKNLDWLDETENNLHYPTSQYRNIRWGLPGE